MAGAGPDIARQEEELADIVLELGPVSESDLEPGDHIAVRRRFPFTYYHHGIFIGEGGVVDFGTTKKKLPTNVRNISISQFTGGRDLVRINYPTGTCRSPDAVVCSANEVLLSPEQWGRYDLKTNNCEHFAMRCKTGKTVSRQVIKATRKLFKRITMTAVNAVGGASSTRSHISQHTTHLQQTT